MQQPWLSGQCSLVLFTCVVLVVMVCGQGVQDYFSGHEIGQHGGSRARGCRGSGHRYAIPTVRLSTNRRSITTVKSEINKQNLMRITFVQDLKDNIKLIYMNARSVNNKSHDIGDYIVDSEADICAISETWLCGGDQDRIACGDLTPTGYSLLHVPRKAKRGGGVAIAYKSSLRISLQSSGKPCVLLCCIDLRQHRHHPSLKISLTLLMSIQLYQESY